MTPETLKVPVTPGSVGGGRTPSLLSPDSAPPAAVRLVRRALAAGMTALDERESKALIAAYGIRVPEGVLVRSAAEAASAATGLGGRLAMKAVGREIHHKTEGGLVMLDVFGLDAVTCAYRTLERRAGSALEAVLVERMITGNRELLVGLKRDKVFGPVVALGLGGVLTEVLGDIALVLVPPSERDVAELPGLLRSERIFGAFRGLPPVHRSALAAVIQAVAQIGLDFPEIAEIDVNPLLIEGDSPIAADALVVLSREDQPIPAAVATSRTARAAFVPDFRPMFSPKSVAIIGASDDVAKWGGSTMRNLLDGGYSGTVYPVNPKGGVVFGLRAYAGVADLPEPPDLALIAVGGRQVKGVLEDCGRRGVRAAVVLAAGFSETGAEGTELERDMAEVAAEHGITLIGPNCIGLMSNEQSFHATGFVTLHPPRGRLSFVSQSGSLGAGVVFTCERQGIGLEKFVSVGNEAQVSAFDVLDYLRDDPATGGIMMYLEGIEDGRHFFEAARAVTPDKPVTVLRGGVTEQGGKAAASHTGAMAGSAEVYRAAARQAGVITCRNVTELVDTSACLTYLPLPQGRRVAVVTNGGGPGVLAADEAVLNGLQLADLPLGLVTALDKILPPFWSRRNPLDLVASAYGDVGLEVMDLVARCDAVDAVVAFGFIAVPTALDEGRDKLPCGELNGYSEWELTWLEHVVRLMEETGKPIVTIPAGPLYGAALDFGGRYRPILLASAGAAMRALHSMAWYGSYVAGRVQKTKKPTPQGRRLGSQV